MLQEPGTERVFILATASEASMGVKVSAGIRSMFLLSAMIWLVACGAVRFLFLSKIPGCNPFSTFPASIEDFWLQSVQYISCLYRRFLVAILSVLRYTRDLLYIPYSLAEWLESCRRL